MAISQPRKPSPCSHSAAKRTQASTLSMRELSFRNTPPTRSVRSVSIRQMQCSAHSGSSCLDWFFLTWQDTQEQITPLTALVPSDSFSNYLDLLSRLLLSASAAGCCCCRCIFLPLLSSDKPIHLCLQCRRCQILKVTLPFSFCRWKMRWVRQIFSSSWTCTLLITNNSKWSFKAQLVMQGFVQLGNYFDEVRALWKKG